MKEKLLDVIGEGKGCRVASDPIISVGKEYIAQGKNIAQNLIVFNSVSILSPQFEVRG